MPRSLTPEAYMDGVRAILPAIRQRAPETDRRGCIPVETIRELEEVGVFRGLQPRQWGGLELHPTTYFESIVLLGSACGSTAWVAGVVMSVSSRACPKGVVSPTNTPTPVPV